MRRNLIYLLAGAVILVVALFIFFAKDKKDIDNLSYTVEQGSMDVLVYASGQLESENSENITVPNELGNRSIRIYEITITDIVEEGTVVDSGDYVALLSHDQVDEKLSEAEDDLKTKIESLEDARMDSSLNIGNAQDAIVNAELSVTENEIALSESAYESPAVIKRAEMDLDRSKRSLQQTKLSYDLKLRQESADIKRRVVEVDRANKVVQALVELRNALRITAPKNGMVIYAKDRFDAKIQVGSTVSPWMPVIATLPDMDNMISRTYINEIDISKISVGQMVEISVDAFPEKQLKGRVVSVANIGQQTSTSDAKVFEVIVKVAGSDSDLKPAMTTGNVINAGRIENSLLIPLDAVYMNDSLKYVYKKGKNGVCHQVVTLGSENENFVAISNGLEKGDVILLAEPESSEDLAWEGMDIYAEQKRRKLDKEVEMEKELRAPIPEGEQRMRRPRNGGENMMGRPGGMRPPGGGR
ncbi:MAG: efflux RND transporter periplasmic adaptor subunit [Bacteroidales bacterium]